MHQRSSRSRLISTLTLAGLAGGALTACTTDDPSSAADGEFTVVASTSVWADVAEEVLDDATVSPLVEDSAIDPHSFEPTASDLAEAVTADLLVVGGGGYDAWLYEPVINDRGEEHIVHALPLIEHNHSHGDDDHDHAHDEDAHTGHEHSTDVHSVDGNEHIWFDIDAVTVVAEDIAAHVAEENPAAGADANAVVEKMNDLRSRLQELPEARVAQTESIGDYLIDDSSLHDVTPEGYRHAVLNHSSPAASDLAAFLDLIETGELDILLFNPQTATDQTERVRTAAEEAGVQIVEIGEIPPADTDFLDYFEEIVNDLTAAAEATAASANDGH